MHPKSFVSNFWGAVQQCSITLFINILLRSPSATW